MENFTQGSGKAKGRRPRRIGGARVALAAVVLLAGLTGGCGHQSRDDLVKIRIAVTPHLTVGPVFIAKAEGFFEDQGLDAELVRINRAATALPSLLQGRLDVLPGPLSPSFFNAIHRGARVRFVADKGEYSAASCSHQALVVSEQAARNGEPFPLHRVAGADEPFLQYFVDRALSEHGYDPTKVEMVHVPGAAEYNAILSGGLDAGMVGEPWLTRIRKTGRGMIWIPVNTFLDGVHYSVFVYGPRLLDQDPELGKRVAVALLEGVRAYNRGNTDRNVQILADALGYDPAELRDICWPHMRDDGGIDPEGILQFEKWEHARGDVDAVLGPDDFYDGRFIQHALRVLGSGTP